MFTILTILLFNLSASACSCVMPLTPYESFDDSAAVFVGTVLSSRDVVINEPNHIAERFFRFKVEDSFKGSKSSEVEIRVGLTSSICYVGFSPGTKYLVYAWAKSENILASEMFCGRTTTFISAYDDIFFLKKRLRDEPEPRIYGSVTLGVRSGKDAGASRSVKGIKVTVEGEGRQKETLTDKNGLYSFYDVPDGIYSVSVDSPSRFEIVGSSDYLVRLGKEPTYEGQIAKPASYIEFYIRYKELAK